MLGRRLSRNLSARRPTDLEHAMAHSQQLVVEIDRALFEQKECNLQIRQLQHMYKSQRRRFTPTDLAHLERTLEAQRRLLRDTNIALVLCLEISDRSEETRQVQFLETKAKRLNTVLGNFGAEIQEFDRLLGEARK